MAGNRKPRKAYRPKPANAAAHAQAMNAVTLLTAEERETCASAPELALQFFVDGLEPAFNWAVMADALNVAEALSDVGICSDLASRETIADGQKTLAVLHGLIRLAGHDWNRLVKLTPQVIASLRGAIEMHRIQLSLCDYSEYRRAVDSVLRKMAGARAGNVAPGTKILEAPMAVEQLVAAGKIIDAADVPSKGRMWWNPETNEVEPLP